MRTRVRSQALLRSGIAVSCGAGCSRSSDLAWLWLWLWCKPTATSLMRPLAREPPHAAGAPTAKRFQTKQKAAGSGFGPTAYRPCDPGLVSFPPSGRSSSPGEKHRAPERDASLSAPPGRLPFPRHHYHAGPLDQHLPRASSSGALLPQGPVPTSTKMSPQRPSQSRASNWILN